VKRLPPFVIALVVIALIVGCGADKEQRASDSIVTRKAVEQAFESVGDPLTIRLDLADSDPDSFVYVIYVPANDDVSDSPVEVTVFESEASAEEHATILENESEPGTQVERQKNVVLTMSPSVTNERRARLVSALKLL
jgi:hypothetical protein